MQIDIDLLLNLPASKVTDFSFTAKEVHISLVQSSARSLCPTCGQSMSKIFSYRVCKVRDMDILGRTTYFHLSCRQFECELCGRYFMEDTPFVQGNHGYTIRYENYLYFMVKDLTIQSMSLKLDVCWATLNTLYKVKAQAEIKSHFCSNFSRVKNLSIDEISIGKGKKKYVCVLRDYETGALLDFLKKRDKTYLESYFNNLVAVFCDSVMVLVWDMWDGYVNLVGEKSVFKHGN